MIDYRRYLQPEYVATFASLELRARMVVEGFMTGLHRSPYRGFSVEFAEHRAYQPGDELRYVDWKVYGRTDRYYIKQYEEETNLRAWIALDASSSMAFSSEGNVSKFEYGVSLAAAISLLLLRQRDAVGSALFDTELREMIPPSARRSVLHQILNSFSGAAPQGERRTSILPSLNLLAEKIRRPGLVVVISDFLEDPADVITALRNLRYRRGNVLALQLLDPLERSFDFPTAGTFRDMETGAEMESQPAEVRRAYRREVEKFTGEIRRGCRENRIEYALIDTATPFDRALLEVMATRGGRTGRRR